MFKQFRDKMQEGFNLLAEEQDALYVVHVPDLWHVYLDAFPDDRRQEYNCSCCRSFIKKMGGTVGIVDNKIVSIWNFEASDPMFAEVANAMDAAVVSHVIGNYFVTDKVEVGTLSNLQLLESGMVHRWHHLHLTLPSHLVTRGDVNSVRSQLNSKRKVLQRSLSEISHEAITAVLDMIAEDVLYRGQEFKSTVEQFRDIKIDYEQTEDQYTWLWEYGKKTGIAVSRMKNAAIGTILLDLTNGVDNQVAIRKFESVMGGYMRSTATHKRPSVDEAEKLIKDAGLQNSLARRHATIQDVGVNDLLWVNRAKADGNIFQSLRMSVKTDEASIKAIPMAAHDFINDVLPNTSDLFLLLPNRLERNLVSLITAVDPESASPFKWSNNFSHVYSGNVASIRANVEKHGGKTDGVLRFSIQWNRIKPSDNDLDAHCVEPDGNRISFRNMRSSRTGGNLDVDIIYPVRGVPAVENITYPHKRTMINGDYLFLVHNYSSYAFDGGLEVEIECNGKTYNYVYNSRILGRGTLKVATASSDFKVASHIKESQGQWDLNANVMHKVTAVMHSPNFWGDNAVGHKHTLFMLDGCHVDEQLNPFFNEYLRSDLVSNKGLRRVMESVGNDLVLEPASEQLSGVGFPETVKNFAVVKADNKFYKVIFS